MNLQSSQKGFTLIELMIVIVIIAILAAIVYPSYQDSVRKARRATAEADLVSLSNFMERSFTETNTYTGVTLPFTVSPQSGTKYYDLGFKTGSPTASAFTLQAVPVAGSAQAGDSCSTLELSHMGLKTSTAGSDCW